MITFGFKTANREEEVDIRKILEPILPEEYDVLVIDFKLIKLSNIIGESQFEANFRVNVTSEDGVKTFIEDYNESSWTTHNSFKGDKRGVGKKSIISGTRKCHHKIKRHGLQEGPSRPKHSGPGKQPACENQPGKNTDCEAIYTFSLSGSKLHTSRGERKNTFATTKEEVEKYPLLVKLNYTHNHSIHSANAMKYGNVSEETLSHFTKLFEQDHTASSALSAYKRKIVSGKTAEEKIRIMADRRVMPSTSWVSHFYRSYKLVKYGPEDGPGAYELAKQRVDAYNEKSGMELAKINLSQDGDVTVAICDHFCRRIHENVPQSGDIVLVDATANLDRHDTKLFHFICPTPAGGLPLGTMITSRENEETVQSGLELFKSVLPENAFFHRGPSKGPKIFMTDDCAAERNAIKSVWPHAVLLLCVFHLLQALWRWLWDSDHKIPKLDRPTLFNVFKSVLYAPNETEFSDATKKMLDHETTKKYTNFVKHIKEKLLPRKEEWSLTTRFEKNYTTHSVNTTNYAEVSFRITKENQFNRIKAHNLADLVDIIFDDSEYYVYRCIDIGNNRTEFLENQKSRYLPKNSTIDCDKIMRQEDGLPNTFLVPSETSDDLLYEVNMDLGLCECPMGMLRGPCKHKHAVAKKFPVISSDVIPSSDSNSDSALRAFYHFIGTGTQLSANWYRPLLQGSDVATDIPFQQDIFQFMRVQSSNDDTGVAEVVGEEPEEPSDVVQDLIPAPSYMLYNANGERIDAGAEDHNKNDDESLIENIEDELSAFSSEIVNRLQTDSERYKDSIKYFMKNVQKIQNATPGKFIKAMYSFNTEFNSAATKGRRKNAGNIGVNSTHRSRRLYKARGSGTAQKGRPSKAVRPRKRGSDPVATILPCKQRKIKNPRNLSKAVAALRPAEKKH